MELIFLVIYLVVTFFWATFIGKQALEKGRSYKAFFWLSFLVSPLLMQIIVATISGGSEEAVTVTASTSASQKISELKLLLDSGAISQAEFDEKKKQLLEQI